MSVLDCDNSFKYLGRVNYYAQEEMNPTPFDKLTDIEVVNLMKAYLNNFRIRKRANGTVIEDWCTKWFDLFYKELLAYVYKTENSGAFVSYGARTYYHLDCQFNKRKLEVRFKKPHEEAMDEQNNKYKN